MGETHITNMEKIANLSEFDEALIITLLDNETEKEKEAVIIDYMNGYSCWLNYCKHITDVKIHKGDKPPIRDDEIVCQNHGAMFNVDDGVCTYGPCKGAKLDSVDIKINDDSIFLTDENYKFIKKGSVEDENIPSSTSGEDEF